MSEDAYAGCLVRTHTRRPSRSLGGKRCKIQLLPLSDALKIWLAWVASVLVLVLVVAVVAVVRAL